MKNCKIWNVSIFWASSNHRENSYWIMNFERVCYSSLHCAGAPPSGEPEKSFGSQNMVQRCALFHSNPPKVYQAATMSVLNEG
jgi:hypothetical protein